MKINNILEKRILDKQEQLELDALEKFKITKVEFDIPLKCDKIVYKYNRLDPIEDIAICFNCSACIPSPSLISPLINYSTTIRFYIVYMGNTDTLFFYNFEDRSRIDIENNIITYDNIISYLAHKKKMLEEDMYLLSTLYDKEK